MRMTAKKKKYEKPSMQVFELRLQPQILAGSGLGGRDPYTPTDDNPFGG